MSKSQDRRVAVQREADPIARLRAVLDAATPGPWRAHNFRSYAHESWSVVADGDEPPVCDDACSERDARAIAALRTLAPELLAVVEAADEIPAHQDWCEAEMYRRGAIKRSECTCGFAELLGALAALRARAAEVLR